MNINDVDLLEKIDLEKIDEKNILYYSTTTSFSIGESIEAICIHSPKESVDSFDTYIIREDLEEELLKGAEERGIVTYKMFQNDP
jgi:hypothetical protein